ncbi:multiheme c-type cytochrome [Thermodesulfobacteriota bacterium]
MMKRIVCCFGWMLSVFLFFGGNVPAQGEELFTVDRDFYPYYPSLIKWNKTDAQFTPPSECGQCHPDQYEQWQGSVHALAFQDPVYQGELNKGFQAVGREVTRMCEGCHSPAGMVTEEIRQPGLTGLGPVAMGGVSCDMCHSISGVTHLQTPSHAPENGSFILSPGRSDGKKIVLTKYGPFDPEPYCGMGTHECIQSPLHLQSDLCASCHQIYHHAKHFPFESTYQEWKEGPYAQQGIMCQDCHMVELETFVRVADEFQKPWRQEYKHYFNGANYFLYALALSAAQNSGNDELAAIIQKKYDMAVGRLKKAADLEITPLYRENVLSEVRIRVKNIRAGHNLPTSLTSIRQMWLEVTARNEDGRVFLSSGKPDDEGLLPESTRIFNSTGMDDNFHFAVDPWVVTSFSRNDTIRPRGYKDVYYGIFLPEGTATVVLSARLKYRQAGQEVLAAILGYLPQDMDLEKMYHVKGIPRLPVVEMVAREKTIERTKQ